TGTMHIYLRPLMAMNPDGTGQRAVYGSNSYWPNALYFPRGIPGAFRVFMSKRFDQVFDSQTKAFEIKTLYVLFFVFLIEIGFARRHFAGGS
ncbi:hypothetical protein ACFL5Z_18250, partial [Planctomycetota bacterium]